MKLPPPEARRRFTSAAVARLVDHYAPDWSALWWARADGRATIHEGDDRLRAIDLLQRKYEQYAERPPAGPMVAIHVTAWSGWSFT